MAMGTYRRTSYEKFAIAVRLATEPYHEGNGLCTAIGNEIRDDSAPAHERQGHDEGLEPTVEVSNRGAQELTEDNAKLGREKEALRRRGRRRGRRGLKTEVRGSVQRA